MRGWLCPLVASLLFSVSAFANPCVDDPDGGGFECTAPTPSSETYGMGECYNCSAPCVAMRDAVFNGCGWGSVSSLGDANGKAACADAQLGGMGVSPGYWRSEGEVWDSFWCGHQTVGVSAGITTYTFAVINEMTTGTGLRPTLVSRRRNLECPAGYSLAYRPNADMVCTRPICDTCPNVGDPIALGNFANTHQERDYDGADLSFSRTYRSDGIFRPTWAPEPVTKAFGANWTHEFEARITPAPAGRPVMALALRPSGAIYFFDSNGRQVTKKDEPLSLEKVASGPIAWRLKGPRGVLEEYDASGALLRITSMGRVLRLSYSDAATPLSIAPGPGFLTRVTDAHGRSLAFSYDGDGHLTRMLDPEGRAFIYEFKGATIPATDPTRNVTGVRYPDGTRRTYLYDELSFTSNTAMNGMLTGIRDGAGNRYLSFGYLANKNAAGTQFSGGVDWFQVAASGSNTNVTNPLGYTSTFEFQTQGGVRRNSAEVRPCVGAGCTGSTRRQLSYDSTGNLSGLTDFDGSQVTYQFDPVRRLELRRTEGAGTSVERTISTQWHPVDDVKVKIAEPLRITTFVYNGDGQVCGLQSDGVTPVPGVICSKSIQPTSDATGAAGFGATAAGEARTWSYTWDAQGRMLTEDGPRTDVSDVTTYTYDAEGNLASERNALGHTQRFTSYNSAGKPLSHVDPNGLVTTYAYDAMNRRIRRDVGGEATSYGYDANGDLARTVFPDGAVDALLRDGAHRIVGRTDGFGNHIDYTLDAAGNVTRQQIFDASGNLLQVASTRFDALSRRFADERAHGETTSLEYGPHDQPVKVTDALGRRTDRSYDALKRVVRATSPMGAEVQLAYDGLDHVVSVVDPRGVQTSFVYDGLDNLVSSFSRDEGVRIFTHDAAGNLTSVVDGKGQLTRFEYDALNRLTAIRYADGTSATRVWDQGQLGIGHVTLVSDATGSTAYAYDFHGRVVRETAGRTTSTGTVSLTTRYAYDAQGRLASMTYPSGRVLSYTYDGAGRVTKVTSTQRGVTTTLVDGATYRPFGTAQSFTTASTSRVDRTFDLDGRMSGFTIAGTQWGVSYDAASRITGLSAPGVARAYAYDDLDRLVHATGVADETFTYDLNGNRLTRAAGTQQQSLSYAASSNRLSQVDSAMLTWDANGNLISDGTRQFSYDARGRLIAVTAGATSARYFVNTAGLRVAKEVRP